MTESTIFGGFRAEYKWCQKETGSSVFNDHTRTHTHTRLTHTHASHTHMPHTRAPTHGRTRTQDAHSKMHFLRFYPWEVLSFSTYPSRTKLKRGSSASYTICIWKWKQASACWNSQILLLQVICSRPVCTDLLIQACKRFITFAKGCKGCSIPGCSLSE